MIRFVEFPSPNGVLRGSLHLPEGDGPWPGVVAMHGFTGQRLESGFLFVGLSRALEAAGLASLRFDFFGSGESDGEFREMTASTERADALAAIDWLKGQSEIDADRVGVLGLSFGGLQAACVLGERRDLKAAALWSAAGRTLQRWQERLTPAEKRALAEQGWINRDGLQLGSEFFDDLSNHHPFEAVAAYGGPVLVVHGTDDGAVPIDEARQYVRVLEARPRGETDHLFVEGGTHTFDNWDHRQTVYAKTVDWFRRHL